MSDIEARMAEWRKNLWGTGPCPDSSQENFTLTYEEREAVSYYVGTGGPESVDAALVSLLSRTGTDGENVGKGAEKCSDRE